MQTIVNIMFKAKTKSTNVQTNKWVMLPATRKK